MNVIEIFKKGNQELFHSAFIAWLLDKNGKHGLGDTFAKKLLSKISYQLETDYTVKTEHSERGNRYDIFIEQKNHKPLILENKVKSFGSKDQSERYLKPGYRFSYLALLKETIECSNVDIIYYKDVLDTINEEKLNLTNHYHFLINEYGSFLRKTLDVYKTITEYCEGTMLWQEAMSSFEENLKGVSLNDNDVRTYTYFFYYKFEEYLCKKSSNLIFGSYGYKEAEEKNENTKWEFEKNMQGPPFLESLIRKFNQPNMKFQLNQVLLRITNERPFIIAPRVEICLDPNTFKEETSKVGTIMLGTWSKELKDFLRDNEPYKSTLKRRGKRHFDHEDIQVKDLIFNNFEIKIRRMMSKIGVLNAE